MVTGNIKVAAKKPGGIHVSFPVPWPARVVGVAGITVSKANGVFVVQPNFQTLQDIVPATQSGAFFWYFDAPSGTYRTITLAEIVTLVGSGGGAPARVITVGGAVAVTANDTHIILNKAAPSVTPITLPAVATRVAGLALTVSDYAGNGGDITFTPNGAEKIMGANTWVVGSGGVPGSGGSITMVANAAVGGWAIK